MPTSPHSTPPRPLEGRVAWITGASRGIGRAVAIELSRVGAHAIIGARNMEQLAALVQVIEGEGNRATAIPLDVADRDACEGFAAQALAAAGPPEILVNNAAIATFRPVDEFLPDEFEHQFRVNVFGTYYMTRAALPHLRESNAGKIVMISSLASESAAKWGSAYFSTKYAMNGFAKCLFEEVRHDGVGVTIVCPGSVDTGFHHESHPGSHPKDQSWMVRPRDVALAVLHAAASPSPALVSRIDVRPTSKPSRG